MLKTRIEKIRAHCRKWKWSTVGLAIGIVTTIAFSFSFAGQNILVAPLYVVFAPFHYFVQASDQMGQCDYSDDDFPKCNNEFSQMVAFLFPVIVLFLPIAILIYFAWIPLLGMGIGYFVDRQIHRRSPRDT